jgi:hypothetical protein
MFWSLLRGPVKNGYGLDHEFLNYQSHLHLIGLQRLLDFIIHTLTMPSSDHSPPTLSDKRMALAD